MNQNFWNTGSSVGRKFWMPQPAIKIRQVFLPAKPISLSNHKPQAHTCYLSVDTFQMEHMETTPTTHLFHHPLPTPSLPCPTQPTPTTSYHYPTVYLVPPPTHTHPLIHLHFHICIHFVLMYKWSLTIVMCMLCKWATDPWSYFFYNFLNWLLKLRYSCQLFLLDS